VDFPIKEIQESDYPTLLSCGARAFVFGKETKGASWGGGSTPTYLDKCIVWPVDITIFGGYHFQKELRNIEKASTLYDVYCGNIDESKKEIYAELIEQGYVVKSGDKLICDVAVSTAKSRELFKIINTELTDFITPYCLELTDSINRIVNATIPAHLKQYAHGFAYTEIAFYSGICLLEALYNKGFLTIPEQGDKSPVACYIYEK
jgi:hypothetical protein